MSVVVRGVSEVCVNEGSACENGGCVSVIVNKSRNQKKHKRETEQERIPGS